MKQFYFLAFALIITGSEFAKAQCRTEYPLSGAAFDKMIIQDITYTIIGENTPTSGIKIDVTKPEATISGAFSTPKWRYVDFVSFDLKAGAVANNLSIFKGFSDFNTAFEFRPSIHYIPGINKAKYGYCETVIAETMIIKMKNDIAENNKIAIIDSFYASAFIKNHYLSSITYSHPNPDDKLPNEKLVTSAQKEVMIYFIKKMTGKTVLLVNTSSDVPLILKELDKVAITKTPSANPEKGKNQPVTIIEEKIDIEKYNSKVLDYYNKYKKLSKDIENTTISKQISNADNIWTKKQYIWFSLSPFARAEKTNEYYTKYEERDSLYIKPNYRFYYGGTAYANLYVVNVGKRAHYVRLGVSLLQASNLNILSNYNYETRTPFFTAGNNTTEKIKSGAGYNNKDINTGFAKQLSIDYYNLPLKSLIPGFYVSLNINESKIYSLPAFIDRKDDRWQIPLEGGLVLNVNSREKDKEKNILTLLVYVRHEDITDKRRTPVLSGKQETAEEFRKRNISMGIRVGIPITLPQRSN